MYLSFQNSFRPILRRLIFATKSGEIKKMEWKRR
jgi:hypothetical protein